MNDTAPSLIDEDALFAASRQGFMCRIKRALKEIREMVFSIKDHQIAAGYKKLKDGNVLCENIPFMVIFLEYIARYKK